MIVALLLLGCEPEPVRAPDDASTLPPAQPTIPEPEPIESTPEPRAIVSMPASVESGEPFVIEYCGPRFDERVQIIFDRQYLAGGLMGWGNGCKRQTIDGLNRSGSRLVEFIVDGQTQEEGYIISVY